MRPVWLRMHTPAGWALVAVVVLALALAALGGLGFRWDPLDLAERRRAGAEARAAAAVADAAGRRLEVNAAADQARRLEQFHQQEVAVARATARIATQARSAHDADLPLDPHRAARLAGHDRELCRLAPAVCGAATVEPAPGGDDAVRACAPARGPDPG
ncbi:MAG: hypothetical protein KJ690_06875 [Alphaproteobacteria bacterium]|nr:hypothetical protein [Alphaproteobacteria bacterium]